jgi:hypothetical protein
MTLLLKIILQKTVFRSLVLHFFIFLNLIKIFKMINRFVSFLIVIFLISNAIFAQEKWKCEMYLGDHEFGPIKTFMYAQYNSSDSLVQLHTAPNADRRIFGSFMSPFIRLLNKMPKKGILLTINDIKFIFTVFRRSSRSLPPIVGSNGLLTPEPPINAVNFVRKLGEEDVQMYSSGGRREAKGDPTNVARLAKGVAAAALTVMLRRRGDVFSLPHRSNSVLSPSFDFCPFAPLFSNAGKQTSCESVVDGRSQRSHHHHHRR